MNNDKITTLNNIIESKLLDNVQSPGRYIGHEINSIKKDISKSDLTIALCFPDVYEVGMSNSGIQIIYHILNSLDNIAVERVFSPWDDAEKIMHEKNIPLFTLESTAAVKDFDVIGFSITNELCYTNVLNMLDLAGLPLRSADRTDDHPLIIAGGGMSNCCEPIAPFIDIFILGEGEQTAKDLAQLLIENKTIQKRDLLKLIDKNFNWAYIPTLFNDNDKNKKYVNAIVEDFENSPIPENPIVPYIDTVHERITIEIMRGCPGRCRFCQASFTRRPIRYKTPEKIFETAKKMWQATGFDTISLLSLSTADYPELEKLLEMLYGYFTDKHVGISLPSLRVDKQLSLLPKFVSHIRKGGLTIAVEAASEKLRKLINKPLTDENLFAAVEQAYQAGWSKVKLYFMAGFPGETEDDIKKIVDLSCDLAMLRKKISKRPASLNVAVSWLVPKPHTPFGWLGQKPREYFENARKIILDRKRQRRAPFLNFKFHDINQSVLESAIGRGGAELADVIETAFNNGAKFDLWSEHFDMNIWENAFKEHGFDVDQLAQKQFKPDEPLPWQHLGGPKHDYLLGHYDDAMQLA